MISRVVRKHLCKTSKLIECTNFLYTTKVFVEMVVGAEGDALEPCYYVHSDSRVITRTESGYNHGKDNAIVDLYYTNEKDMLAFVNKMRCSLHSFVSEGRLAMCSLEIVGKGATLL